MIKHKWYVVAALVVAFLFRLYIVIGEFEQAFGILPWHKVDLFAQKLFPILGGYNKFDDSGHIVWALVVNVVSLICVAFIVPIFFSEKEYAIFKERITLGSDLVAH